MTNAHHTYDPSSQREAISGLHEFLKDHQGQAVEIDLQTVASLPGRIVELLLCGHKHWAAEAQDFLIRSQNPALNARMTAIGVPAHLFSEGN